MDPPPREDLRVVINRSSLMLSQEPVDEQKHVDEEQKQVNASPHATIVADQDHLMISIELDRIVDDAEDTALV